MILPIVLYGNDVLRQKGRVVHEITHEIEQLAANMLETMEAHDGVGLAAQQIGLALQMAVVDISGAEDRPSQMWINSTEVDPSQYMPMILINPEIHPIKTRDIDVEGCLSFPGVSGKIARSKKVRVTATNLKGETFEFEAAGLLGRAIQHEHDHLQGILFIDHMTPQDRQAMKPTIEVIRKKGAASSAQG